jgi:hypothetical protein
MIDFIIISRGNRGLVCRYTAGLATVGPSAGIIHAAGQLELPIVTLIIYVRLLRRLH